MYSNISAQVKEYELLKKTWITSMSHRYQSNPKWNVAYAQLLMFVAENKQTYNSHLKCIYCPSDIYMNPYKYSQEKDMHAYCVHPNTRRNVQIWSVKFVLHETDDPFSDGPFWRCSIFPSSTWFASSTVVQIQKMFNSEQTDLTVQ